MHEGLEVASVLFIGEFGGRDFSHIQDCMALNCLSAM